MTAERSGNVARASMPRNPPPPPSWSDCARCGHRHYPQPKPAAPGSPGVIRWSPPPKCHCGADLRQPSGHGSHRGPPPLDPQTRFPAFCRDWRHARDSLADGSHRRSHHVFLAGSEVGGHAFLLRDGRPAGEGASWSRFSAVVRESLVHRLPSRSDRSPVREAHQPPR